LRVDSKKVFDELGYDYLYRVEPGSEPSYVDLRFKDIVPEFSSLDIGSYRLYEHQFLGYRVLSEGKNLIMVSGTGSGKTEVWILYVMNMLKKNRNYRVLALYPTLALANDQIKRINRYLSTIGNKPLQLDSVKRQEYENLIGRKKLRELVGSSNIVISNPAFILHDLKKLLIQQTRALLYSFYKKLDLIIIDEIDFYSPRSLALLLAMIKILCSYSDVKPQIAILTATLVNPDDLGKYLEEQTGRKYSVVRGKPFNVENHLYIVLGKNIKSIWERLKSRRREILENIDNDNVREEISKALENYEYFSQNIHRIIPILNSYGVETPTPTTDHIEIISKYLEDEYVTLVFTYSISQAEEIVRSIKYRYGEESKIVSHHHLVPKKKREEIEEKARKGELKVIVSPRTLSQGIDIGLVARIVHVGLPDNVREYYQREGRKGRRRELGFSETIIIPFSRWDRELLSRGFNVFEKWLEMGIEKTLVNPNNLYIYLFTGLAKLRSPWFRSELNEYEKEALKRVGILTSKGVNEKLLKWIYERMNFYEFAPPYGIKRYLISGDREIPLEPIGHCDLVEKFQPGNIDYSEEAIVTHLETGYSNRYVRAVYEKPIREINFYSDEAFSIALEEYRHIKMQWGEKPSILRDILSGRLSSEELCVVYTPWNGFGKYKKIPDRCIWRLRSEKPRVRSIGDRIIVYYDRRQIYVPKPTAGEYRDYTYGYVYSVDPGENSELLRLALATLMIILRRKYGIEFETIMYDVIKLGEYKYFSLHEPESAGIIDLIDWLDVRRTIEEYRFDELDSILLSEIDDISYSILISYDFDWETVRKQLIRVIDYILAKDRVKLSLSGVELAIPKPSPGLKLLSLTTLVEVFDEETEAPHIFVALNVFDGDRDYGGIALYPPIPYVKPPDDIVDVEKIVLEKIFYENYNLVITDIDKLLFQLKTANLRQLVMLINNYRDKAIDVSRLGREVGFDPFSHESLADIVFQDIEGIEPANVYEALKKIRDRKSISEFSRDKIMKYLSIQARKTYLSYLILRELKKQKR